MVDLNGIRAGILVCEDIWEPEPAAQARERRRRRCCWSSMPRPTRSTSSASASARSARTRVGETGHSAGVRQSDRRPGRAGVRRQFLRHGCAAARSPCAPRHSPRACTRSISASTRTARSAPLPGAVAPLQAEEESVYGALVQGTRDYVDKHRFPGRGARTVRRRRFRADAVHRGRCARRRAGAFGGHALALHLADEQGRCRAAGAHGSTSSTARSPSRACSRRRWRRCRDEFAGRPAGYRRGEHPIALPRRAAHGHLEQDRPHAAHHRQQERNGGGLRHAVRRHGRRLRAHQGLQQAAGLPPVRLAQRAIAGDSARG